MELNRTKNDGQTDGDFPGNPGSYDSFFNVFLWQLLRMFMVLLGMGGGLSLGFYAGRSTISNQLWQILFYSLIAVGFLTGVGASYLIEYRRRLSISSFLGEVLLTFIAITVIGACVILGIQGGIKAGSAAVHYDGTGIFVLLFLLSGGLVGFIPGIILALLLTTLWKFWRSRRSRRLSPPETHIKSV